MVRDESLSRSLMLLCFVAATLLLGAKWRSVDRHRASTVENAAIATSSNRPEPEENSIQTARFPENSNVTKTSKSESRDRDNHTTRLVVDLSDRHVYVYRADRLQTRYPVAVGKAGWETPTGVFKVSHMQRNPGWRHPITKEVVPAGPKNPLGAFWIGFWSNGRHAIGFHGTNQDRSIGQAISHGCLRMHNRDIAALYNQVVEGTPVEVRP